MIKVCGVRLTPNGKIYMFDPKDVGAEKGDFVVVESLHGNILGEVVYGEKEIGKADENTELRPVVRIATNADLKTAAENEELAKNAFELCKQLIAQQGLDMKLFKTEYTLDRSKAVFYYVSEQRVDFRNLVKELAPRIKIRIEMVQVGPREHAKAIGGVGLCGRQFCCQGFMTTFEPVTIKMAKDQGLTSNPTKYSGSCGKLLCCIRHEEAAYEYAHGIMPKNGSLIMTEDGPGKIIVVNMLKETCTVKVGLEQNFEIKSYGIESIRQLTDAERAEYLALRRREKEEMEAEVLRRQSKNDDERNSDAPEKGRGGQRTETASRSENAESGTERVTGQFRKHRENSRKDRRPERTASADAAPAEKRSETPKPLMNAEERERGRNSRSRRGKRQGGQEGKKQNPKRENRQSKWKKFSGDNGGDSAGSGNGGNNPHRKDFKNRTPSK